MREDDRAAFGHTVVGGVDTHLDMNVAAVLGCTGALLGTAEFPATLGGHAQLLSWMRSFGDLAAVGVEDTGNYGAGLARFLLAEGARVVEVARPDRRARRLRSKSDALDAENPERMRSEASFAMLCGVAPLPASSGKVRRYRLNRGGERAANCALHMAAISRLRVDSRTREYAARRAAEGLSKKEILRCLKRYLARELYKLLRPTPPAAPYAA